MIIYSSKPLRKRAKSDFYPTPGPLCKAALELVDLPIDDPKILDPGAGEGVWGRAAKQKWPNCFLTGIDIRNTNSSLYDVYRGKTNFLTYKPDSLFDLVIGNPPYRNAEDFTALSILHLKPGGKLVFLLRLAFLESRDRYHNFWRDYVPYQVVILSNRPSFTGNNKTDATAYALYYFEKGRRTQPRLDWLLWR